MPSRAFPGSLPLRAELHDPAESFQLRFAQPAQIVLADYAVKVVASATGLSLACLWHGDLEQALEGLRSAGLHPTVRELAVAVGPEPASEPVIRLTIRCPNEGLGDLIGDLTSRRSRVTDMSSEGDQTVVTCVSPVVELDGTPARIAQLRGVVVSATFGGFESGPEPTDSSSPRRA